MMMHKKQISNKPLNKMLFLAALAALISDVNARSIGSGESAYDESSGGDYYGDDREDTEAGLSPVTFLFCLTSLLISLVCLVHCYSRVCSFSDGDDYSVDSFSSRNDHVFFERFRGPVQGIPLDSLSVASFEDGGYEKSSYFLEKISVFFQECFDEPAVKDFLEEMKCSITNGLIEFDCDFDSGREGSAWLRKISKIIGNTNQRLIDHETIQKLDELKDQFKDPISLSLFAGDIKILKPSGIPISQGEFSKCPETRKTNTGFFESLTLNRIAKVLYIYQKTKGCIHENDFESLIDIEDRAEFMEELEKVIDAIKPSQVDRVAETTF